MLHGELPCFLGANLSQICQVSLVANQYFDDVDVGMLVNALQPGLNVLETVLTCDVKNHDHTVTLTIKALCHAAEPVLSCRVPDLHIDGLSCRCDVGV